MTIRQAFADQGRACATLGSPFMARLMPLIGERLTPGTAVADRILSWPGDVTAAGDSVPLRLAGALHALSIRGLALTGVYPPNDVPDDSLWQAVEAALTAQEAWILEWLDSAPQTNEVRRAAVLLPALALVRQMHGQPVELLELGTSAGLNLRCDRFRLDLPGGWIGEEISAVRLAPAWEGPAPEGPLPRIIQRRGVDLNPLDPTAPEDRLRLLAYLWPDQPERAALTEAAIRIARDVPAEIARDDAGAWTEEMLAEPAVDRVRVLFHTVAWQYFPVTTKARASAAMARVPSPLVQIAMEADGGEGAAIRMTLWPEGETRDLGRASFHGLWVRWAG
jgi:hypothetical protein